MSLRRIEPAGPSIYVADTLPAEPPMPCKEIVLKKWIYCVTNKIYFKFNLYKSKSRITGKKLTFFWKKKINLSWQTDILKKRLIYCLWVNEVHTVIQKITLGTPILCPIKIKPYNIGSAKRTLFTTKKWLMIILLRMRTENKNIFTFFRTSNSKVEFYALSYKKV